MTAWFFETTVVYSVAPLTTNLQRCYSWEVAIPVRTSISHSIVDLLHVHVLEHLSSIHGRYWVVTVRQSGNCITLPHCETVLTGTMTQCPTQPHNPFTEQISPMYKTKKNISLNAYAVRLRDVCRMRSHSLLAKCVSFTMHGVRLQHVGMPYASIKCC